MVEKNYHSRLIDISNKWDGVIETLKSAYVDKKLSMPWWLWLLTSPLRDIKRVISLKEGISSFFKTNAFLSILPILSSILLPLINWALPINWASPDNVNIPVWVELATSFILGYIISMGLYFPQLLQFKSPHFHLGAYKTFRKQEYELFKGAFLDSKGDFYFKGIYDYITNSKEGYQMIENLIQTFLQNEKVHYESRIHYLEETIKEINSSFEDLRQDYDEFALSIISERDELLEEFEYVIELLKDINTLLFRIHNKGLSVHNLDILTGFTLYELKGNKLIQKADVRTSGITANEIELDDPRYQHYGMVKVIKDNLNRPYYNHPYEGHVVVSFKMNIDNKGIWVYNFHFDDSNTKARKLIMENGIIESKEIYRLVHALCLLSQDYLESKGAVNQ
ncbi:hypothetical protein [Neobacillus sp.]|uniref:hypothetical protein n=1 Tax=Neobacillus sp. TaxID=2675273 RepID=UPI0035B56B9B